MLPPTSFSTTLPLALCLSYLASFSAGHPTTTPNSWKGPFFLESSELMDMVESKVVDTIVESVKKVAKQLNDKGGLENLEVLLKSLDIELPKGKKGDQCQEMIFKSGNSSSRCIVEFKIFRLSSVLPRMLENLSKVEDSIGLLKSLLPLLNNPCTCQPAIVGVKCPRIAHKLAKTLSSFC